MAKKKQLQDTARKVITHTTPRSVVSEQFRTLRTNVNFASPDTELRTIVLTSAAPGEGKSTTSANLATVFAQEGKQVLLVDADMRKPTTHYTFHMPNSIGLSNVLTRQKTVEEAVRPTSVDRLNLMTSGPIPPNPAELLASNTMGMLIAELKKMFDVVIFDAPPVLSVTDGQVLANKCDGVILVVNSGGTERDMAVKAKEAIEASNSKLIGAVLNNFELAKDSNYYQYYGSHE